MDKKSELISPSEIATRLGISKAKVEHILRNEKVPFGFAIQSEDGTCSRWRYICARAAFEHWIKYGMCPVTICDREGNEVEPC